MTAQAPDIASLLAQIAARLAQTEAKVDRLLAAIYPDERQLEARAFLDSLEGLSVDEMRARNRERNRRLKETKTRRAI